jgi:hypothetical protein
MKAMQINTHTHTIASLILDIVRTVRDSMATCVLCLARSGTIIQNELLAAEIAHLYT